MTKDRFLKISAIASVTILSTYTLVLVVQIILNIIKQNMGKVGKITNTWQLALSQIKNNQTEEAIESLDKCLLILAMATEDKENKLDGVKIDTWKVRVWVKLEELNAVPEYDSYI